MRAYIIAPVLALAFAAFAPAVADTPPGARLNVPREQWLTPTQITEKLTAAGYKVTEIETDDGAYEVELVDKNGVRVEGYVHPATGELLVGYDD